MMANRLYLRRYEQPPAIVTMPGRRALMAQAFAGTAALCMIRSPAFAALKHPDPKWHTAAVQMRQLAEAWGDQSYGAVLVAGGVVVGEGPSRVLKDKNPDAHAERVAILDAQRRLGRENLAGSVLYSTSRPCPACEAAASRAGVSRMYFGHALEDAGSPLGRTP
ncbi:deaminase [Polaromonas sp.]|uniref:deaminase n=1 Tax=Polaromonas sp. TaxID=1869339 RepID=UPI003524E728